MSQAQYQDGSGIEMAYHDAPETIRYQTAPEALGKMPYEQSSAPIPYYSSSKFEQFHSNHEGQVTILGLKQRTFWVVMVIVMIVTAAAVGGGVGGALGSKHSTAAAATSPSSSPSFSSSSLSSFSSTSAVTTTSTSSTSTSTTPLTSPTPLPISGILAIDCPVINGTVYESTLFNKTYSFLIHCNYDYPEPTDLYYNETLTIDECMDSCALWNTDTNNQECLGMTWNANLTASLSHGGNCFLKQTLAHGVNIVNSNIAASAILMSA